MKIGRVDIHPHWLQTILLDVVLLLVVTLWYMTATPTAPAAPEPQSGHIYSAPVMAHQNFRPCYTGCVGGTVFRRGYVGPLTYAILLTILLNWLLLLAAVMFDFFRILWGPPPAYDE